MIDIVIIQSQELDDIQKDHDQEYQILHSILANQLAKGSRLSEILVHRISFPTNHFTFKIPKLDPLLEPRKESNFNVETDFLLEKKEITEKSPKIINGVRICSNSC